MKLKAIILLISTLSFSLSFAHRVRVDLHGMGGDTGLKLNFTPDNFGISSNVGDTNGCVSSFFPYGVASNCAGSNWISSKNAIEVKQDKDGNNVNITLNLENRHGDTKVNDAIYNVMNNRISIDLGGLGYGYDNDNEDWHAYTKREDFMTKVSKYGFDAYTFGTLTIVDRSDKDSDGKSKKYKCNIMLATFSAEEASHNWEIFFRDQNLCDGLAISLHKAANTGRVIQIKKIS